MEEDLKIYWQKGGTYVIPVEVINYWVGELEELEKKLKSTNKGLEKTRIRRNKYKRKYLKEKHKNKKLKEENKQLKVKLKYWVDIYTDLKNLLEEEIKRVKNINFPDDFDRDEKLIYKNVLTKMQELEKENLK